ncbi:Excitatory amino acid transporter 3 [Sarcoptes scabiei]|nr:Excitatory amino acid transporter 3 [Sarcoptes scabiei]
MAILSPKCKRIIVSNRFALYTGFSVMAGVVCGLCIKTILWSDGKVKIDHQTLRYIALPGVIYMRSFMLIIAPLLVTSLSLSFLPSKIENQFDKLRRFNGHQRTNQYENRATDINHNRFGDSSNETIAHKLIWVTFITFGLLSLLAAIFGACMMLTFGPLVYNENDPKEILSSFNDTGQRYRSDSFLSSKSFESNQISSELIYRRNLLIHRYYQHDTVYNILLNIFPDNVLTPFFLHSYRKTKILWPSDLNELMKEEYEIKTRSEHLFSYKINMLSLCILSIFFGVILHRLGAEKTQTIRTLLYETDNIIHYTMHTLMKLLPIGMFFWMLAESIKVNSMLEMAVKLAYFYSFVIGSFMFWLLIFYPTLYLIITHENPFRLYKSILSAIFIAFGSCSSAITLPETMRCMREKCHLSNRVCQTVLPLGMTLHMNGPAMFFPMTAIFVAYINQCPVEFYSVIVLCLFAVILSMGVPPVIGTGTTMLNHIAVASVLGVDNPHEILAYVLAFEWMMERIRTMCNIIGDCFAAKCIERILDIRDDDLDQDHWVETESEEKL